MLKIIQRACLGGLLALGSQGGARASAIGAVQSVATAAVQAAVPPTAKAGDQTSTQNGAQAGTQTTGQVAKEAGDQAARQAPGQTAIRVGNQGGSSGSNQGSSSGSNQGVSSGGNQGGSSGGSSQGSQAGNPLANPATPLTMRQAVEIARQQNPALLSAVQNLLSVRAQEEQAAVRANPYLQLGGTNISLPAQGASNPYAYSVGVSRLFERGQKRRWRLEGARSTTAQTEAQYETQVQQVELSVRQAFTTTVLAKASLQVARENLADFQRELKIFEERLNAGDIAQLDYKRLDLQLAQFESDQTAAQTALAQASDQLQTLLGVERPIAAFDVAGDVLPPVVPYTRDELEQKALVARPDYSAARYSIEVADANLRLARANRLTDPTLEGEYDRSGTYNSAGFYLNVPIRIFDRNRGNIDTTRYLTQATRFTETAIHNQVISDVSQAWTGYTGSKALADRYTTRYLKEAKDVRDIVQFSYEHGGIALIDYLDAIREYRAVSTASLNAYTQAWNAIHQLSYATATDVMP